MRRFVILLIISICFFGCKAQNLLKYQDLKYAGVSYQGTLNSSFVNKRIVFTQGADSIVFNVKIPWDSTTKNINDPGIFYNCTLKQDTVYSFVLKKVSPAAIPKGYNSYYLSNGKFHDIKKSKFTEISKNTPYKYQGTNGMFIDIDHDLLLIEKMSPTTDCVFQH